MNSAIAPADGNGAIQGRQEETILVLVADKGRARLFRIPEGEDDLLELKDFVNADARMPESMQVRDRQGRGTYGGLQGGHGRRATFGKSGSRRYLSSDHFASEICAEMTGYLKDTPVKHIYLIAGPRLMGTIRPHLHDIGGQFRITEIIKDITRLDVRTIRSYLPKTLWKRRIGGVMLD